MHKSHILGCIFATNSANMVTKLFIEFGQAGRLPGVEKSARIQPTGAKQNVASNAIERDKD